MKVKYEDRLKQQTAAITTGALVVGVDTARNDRWARFVDFRGIEHGRALKFKNSKGDFNKAPRDMQERKFHESPCRDGTDGA